MAYLLYFINRKGWDIYGAEIQTIANRESGKGRYDIVMKTPSRRGLAIIFELKVAASMDDLEEACKRGLRQIEEKGYEQELREDGYRNIKKYAIAFYKKDCEVMGE